MFTESTCHFTETYCSIRHQRHCDKLPVMNCNDDTAFYQFRSNYAVNYGVCGSLLEFRLFGNAIENDASKRWMFNNWNCKDIWFVETPFSRFHPLMFVNGFSTFFWSLKSRRYKQIQEEFPLQNQISKKEKKNLDSGYGDFPSQP
jgi:hypothetical protein